MIINILLRWLPCTEWTRMTPNCIILLEAVEIQSIWTPCAAWGPILLCDLQNTGSCSAELLTAPWGSWCSEVCCKTSATSCASPAMICCFQVHNIFKANSPLPFCPPRNSCYLFCSPSQKILGHSEKLHQQQFLWAIPWFPPEAPQLWMTQGNILLVMLGKFKLT